MAFQIPITVRDTVNAIHERRYLLPPIQREFVWGETRICGLFDSLMRGYPIGSFLFWKIASSPAENYQLYDFLTRYHERDARVNSKVNELGGGDFTAVLDGQQRLTSLYIGLKGTYASKLKNKKKNNPNAYPERKLFLNLAAPLPESELFGSSMTYNFAFLTPEQAIHIDDQTFWFEVGKILTYDRDDPSKIHGFLVDNDLGNNQFAGRCLFKLNDAIQRNPVINYFQEEETDPDKALDIFVRVNSGKPLTHAETLLSLATNQWKLHDAKEEIRLLLETLNRVDSRFKFDMNFVLKASLVLTDADVAFKIRNFNSSNLSAIESSFNDIKKALSIAVDLIATFGYDAQKLIANNAVIPIAYYLKSIGANDSFCSHSQFREDRLTIRRWLTAALLKRMFSGQSDTTLGQLRTTIQKAINSGQGIKAFGQLEASGHPIHFSEQDIQGLLNQEYGTNTSFLALSLLYDNLDYRNVFHIDHVHPRSFFDPKKMSATDPNEFIRRRNRIGNLQLLEGPDNLEKQAKPLQTWIDQIPSHERSGYMSKHYLPQNENLDFSNFVNFFNERETLISARLRQVLNGSNSH